MHEAYTLHSILKHVHIESIAAYENNVILGTRSGQLIMYSVGPNYVLDMLIFNKYFSKKAITQMEVIPAENLLFVLTDNIIHVCDIRRIESNFALIHSSPLTKGCSLFTLDVVTPKSTTGVTATVIRVCCAIRRRLQFFYWKLNTLYSPDFSIELKDVPKAMCWVDDVVCIGFKDEYVLYDIHSNKPVKHDLIVTSSSNSMDPCLCLMKNNLLGVSKDEYLVTIDPSKYAKKNDDSICPGARTNNTLTWKSPLLGLVWDEPYAIGRMANSIEIHCLEGNSLNKETLVQTIPEKIKFFVRASKGNIFAATHSELWCMRLVDIPTQRQNLLEQKKFHLAIELTVISDDPEEVKSETIRQIYMRYAKELFATKQFADAMGAFEKAAANPYDVIRLFPNLKPLDANNLMTNVMPILEDKDMENALLALVEFLALARQREIVKIRDTKGSSTSSLLSIIDTTLLKCYLQTNDSLAAPLLRLNQCHFEESEKILKKHGKISELIILYQTKGKHKEALQLLQEQSSIEGSSLHGHERTIQTLQLLGSTNLQLIFEFSDWVIRKYPAEGLRIFTDNFIEVENLPRANVLDYLLSKHKQCVIPYLEHVIYVWKDTNTFLHNVLVKQYREKVEQQQVLLKLDAGDEKRQISEDLQIYRSKLYKFLKESESYSPDVVLKDFPTNTLLAERALILGRLKKHDKVLAIYIQILGDIQKATEYCENNYEQNNDIFLILLKIILNPLKDPPYQGVELHPDFLEPNHDIVLELLNKYALKIKPDDIWPYLPDDMPLIRLQNYMETILRSQMARAHQYEIMESLLTAEYMRVREQIREQENKSVIITESTICPECNKRFTNQSAFVRYPNGDIMHLSCHDKKS